MINVPKESVVPTFISPLGNFLGEVGPSRRKEGITEVIYFPWWFFEMNSGGAIHGKKITVGRKQSNGKGI